MTLLTEWLTFGANDAMRGYLAVPERAAATVPAIVVLQEIWGVDEHIRDVTDRFARAGYAAFAPDLYHQDGLTIAELSVDRVAETKRFLDTLPPGQFGNAEARAEALSRLPDAQRERIDGTLQKLFAGPHRDRFGDIAADAAAFLQRDLPLTAGAKVASVGFCMGGALSAGLAARYDGLAGAVMFYGTPPQGGQVAAIRCPVLGFFAEHDPRITGQIPEFAEAMRKENKPFEYHVYAGAHHAFFNDTRPSYNVAAARDAFSRTLSFFREVLA